MHLAKSQVYKLGGAFDVTGRFEIKEKYWRKYPSILLKVEEYGKGISCFLAKMNNL